MKTKYLLIISILILSFINGENTAQEIKAVYKVKKIESPPIINAECDKKQWNEIKLLHIDNDRKHKPEQFPSVTLKKYGLINKDSKLAYNNTGEISVNGLLSVPTENIIFDHITARNAVDSGLDLWCDIHNVTNQYSSIVYGYHPLPSEQKIFDVVSDSLKKSVTWSIGIYTGTSPFRLSSPVNVSNPVLMANDITDVKATLIAHPFMIKSNSLYYMFFTIKNKKIKQGKGYIGLAESKDGFIWSYKQIALSEPFVLYYSMVFEWQNEYYMIPETYTEKTLRLYKSVDFPIKWVFEKELLHGDEFVSPTINNMWWLFTVHSGNNTLRLFYSSGLKGEWKGHPLSPIFKDNLRTARPSRRPLIVNRKLYRIAHDSYPIYEYQLRAFEITNISKMAYEEKLIDIPIIEATSKGWNAYAMHHVDLHKIDKNFWIAPVEAKGILLMR